MLKHNRRQVRCGTGTRRPARSHDPYLTVEADSAPSEVSVGVQTASLAVHLRVVVTVEGVAVTVARCNQTTRNSVQTLPWPPRLHFLPLKQPTHPREPLRPSGRVVFHRRRHKTKPPSVTQRRRSNAAMLQTNQTVIHKKLPVFPDETFADIRRFKADH